jgi:beta-phosphoglucomutase-like phosphatase (HAD superfamily)
VLEAAGLDSYVEARVDGNVKDALHLRGKPAPDTFLEGARRGVAAGRAGNFGHVVGVDRAGQREVLLEHGADVVVDELTELL